MIKRSVQQICEMINGQTQLEQFGHIQIQGVSTDSRTIQPGNLFIPLIGDKFNGHEYINEVIAKGAAACFWDRKQPSPPPDAPLILVDDTLEALQQLAKTYRQQLQLRVVGITGSNGKTTTKDIVASLLATQYKVHKTKGNLNNHIGLPLTMLQLEEDTEVAVLEMGMSGRGEIHFLSQLASPDAAIITNIGESHLLQLGSREGITEAKLEIADGLKPNGVLIFNGDEPLLRQGLTNKKMPDETQLVTFGLGEGNDLFPRNIVIKEQGTQFKTNQEDAVEFYVPLLGQHNVGNALAGIAVAAHFGVTIDNIRIGLQQLQMTSMRIEVVKGESGLTILNDAYNASPTSMKAALLLLRELQGYRHKIAVLADMLELGPREEEFHHEIGSQLSSNDYDYVYTFGKLASYLAEGAKPHFPADRVVAFDSKEALVYQLKSHLLPQDVVLIKGSRGMRMEEVVQQLRLL